MTSSLVIFSDIFYDEYIKLYSTNGFADRFGGFFDGVLNLNLYSDDIYFSQFNGGFW